MTPKTTQSQQHVDQMMMMSWTDLHEKEIQQWPEDVSSVQIFQQPVPHSTTIFQQLPVTSHLPPVRPGHIREDLVELMMMQNAQMHQVIMNNMTMSVLNTSGMNTREQTAGIDVMSEEEPDVYHHYYPSGSGSCYPGWVPLPRPMIQAPPPLLHNIQIPPQPVEPVPTKHTDRVMPFRKTVPPPSPSSATQTVIADVPPDPVFCSREGGSDEH